jgi:hypothetical protein
VDTNLYAGFSASKGVLPALIRLFSGTLATHNAVNHMFLCWQDEHLGWMTLGANSNGVTPMTWKVFTSTRFVAALFRPSDPKHSLWAGLTSMENAINAAYNYPAIVGIGLLGIANFVLCNRLKSEPNILDRNKREFFCDEFGIEVIRASGLKVLGGEAADKPTPQDVMHYMVRSTDFVQGMVPS